MENSDDDDDFGNNDESIFEKIESIGSGTYGTVYKGRHTKTNQTIAIKKIKIDLEFEGIPSTALREITILRELHHENIVKLLDIVCCEKKLYLLFEYLDYDLKRYLDTFYKEKDLEIDLIKSFMTQILKGVSYCHSRKIIHRDLKPQNLLINHENNTLKIGDFGLARTFSIPNRPYTKEVLTLWYRAPELLLGTNEYSTPVDIWSIGCIFAEMYIKQPLFRGVTEIDELNTIFEIKGTPTKDIWFDIDKLPNYNLIVFKKYKKQDIKDVIKNMDDDAIDLFQKMTEYDPNKRITAKDALNHPFLKNNV